MKSKAQVMHFLDIVMEVQKYLSKQFNFDLEYDKAKDDFPYLQIVHLIDKKLNIEINFDFFLYTCAPVNISIHKEFSGIEKKIFSYSGITYFDTDLVVVHNLDKTMEDIKKTLFETILGK